MIADPPITTPSTGIIAPAGTIMSSPTLSFCIGTSCSIDLPLLRSFFTTVTVLFGTGLYWDNSTGRLARLLRTKIRPANRKNVITQATSKNSAPFSNAANLIAKSSESLRYDIFPTSVKIMSASDHKYASVIATELAPSSADMPRRSPPINDR